MVLSTETFYQSVRTEYSEAVNARYTFQPLWVSDKTERMLKQMVKPFALALKAKLAPVKESQLQMNTKSTLRAGKNPQPKSQKLFLGSITGLRFSEVYWKNKSRRKITFE